MSIQLMTAAWQAELPSGPKFVLISLCDQSNDDGVCWPSIATIAERCSMGERTVQMHIQSLEREGYLSRKERSGTSSLIRINPRRFCTPAESAPPQELHPTPAESAPHPRKICGGPPQNLHPNPKEPKEKPKGTQIQRETRRDRELSLLTGRGVDPKHATDWLTIRGKHALTDTALAGIEREAAAAGITLAEAVRIAAERGWRGFSAAWLADKSARPTTTDRSKAVANANAAMVARLSGQTIEGEVIHDPR